MSSVRVTCDRRMAAVHKIVVRPVYDYGSEMLQLAGSSHPILN